jgi:subtilisin family serine protease
MTKAQATGRVRVIVGIDAPFQLEGSLAGTAQINAQRMAIQTARQQVISQLSAVNAQAQPDSLNWTIPFVALEVDQTALAQLAASPHVTSVEEDIPERANIDANIILIGAPSVWSAGYDGAGQTVVIIDTGIDGTHQDFGGQIVAERCYSTPMIQVIQGEVTLCQNGASGPGAASPLINNCYETIGDDGTENICDHGTHVAAIAAGEFGVAPGGVRLPQIVRQTRLPVYTHILRTNSAPCRRFKP